MTAPDSAITPSELRPGPRYETIDGLRGLAAAMVFGFHLNEKPWTLDGAVIDLWRGVWKYGYLGVPLFFVISGVCITQTWLRTESATAFLRRRLRRIFPPYWASLALIAGLALVVKLLTGINDVAPLPHTVGALFATLVLATKPVTAVPTANWVYWSLSFELAFYLVMTALLLTARPWRAVALCATHVGLCILGAATPTALWRPLFFVELWPLFGTGAALALWREHRRLAVIMGLASGVHAAVCLTQDRLLAYWLTAAWGAMVCAAALAGHGWSRARPLARLGEMSYSLYLLHVPVGIYLISRVLPSFGSNAAAEIIRQAVIFAATVALVPPFFQVFEKPFLSGGTRSVTPAGVTAAVSRAA